MCKTPKCLKIDWRANNKEQTQRCVGGVLHGGLPPIVVWCVGELVVCFLRVPTTVWFGGVGELVCWCQCMCVPDGGSGGCPLWFGGVVCVLVVCSLVALPIVGWRVGVLVLAEPRFGRGRR